MNRLKMRRIKKKIFNSKLKILFIIFFLMLFTLSSGYALYSKTINISGEASIEEKAKCDLDITGDFDVINSWGENEIAKIYVTNNTEEVLDSFKIEMKLPKGTILTVNGVKESVNGEVTVPDSGIITLTSSEEANWLWQNQINPGNWTLQIGIKYLEIDLENKLYPDWITFNGCTIYGDLNENDLKLSSLSINPNEITVAVGGVETLDLQKSPSNASDSISWSSSDEKIATVDNNGTVTGISEGVVTISAYSGEIVAKATITVSKISIEKLIITPSTYKMSEGEIISLVAEKTPSNAPGGIVWSSSDEKIATVDSNGSVTAINAGTAIITATIDNVSSTCTITVLDESSVSDIKIDFSVNSIWTTTTGQFTVTIKNNSSEPINKVIFDVLMPEGTTYNFWWNVVSNENNTITFNNYLSANSSIDWGGGITVPSNYNLNDYSTPKVYNIRTE